MKKSRNARRVLSRYSRHNRINKKKLVISDLSGRGAALTVKSRREKRRRLSLIGRSGEMGSGSKSDGQDDELPSSTVSAKKLKSHKKIYEDCNGVDRASIPRKLRSVTKKRTCHNISESLTYPKNHVNGFLLTTKKQGLLKKPNSGVFNPEYMSKDEKEAVEALYSLAGMVPRKVTCLENKPDDESPSEEQLHFKTLDDSLLSSQGPQASDEVAEDTSNQISEELSGEINEIMQVGELGKSAPIRQPKLFQTKDNLNASLQANHQSLTKTSLWTMKNNIEEREVLLSQRHSGSTGDLACQDKHEHASTGGKKNGSISFPSLHLQPSHDSGAHDGFRSQYYATKIPYWLHTVASSSEPGLHPSNISHHNEAKVEKCSKRIKNRCPTHVYISHFIQLSQKAQGKEISLLETIQHKTSEGANLRVLETSSHPNPVIKESSKMVPDSHTRISIPSKNIPEGSNDTVMTLGRCSHGQDQPASLVHGSSTSTKRCFDFLSLSTGDLGTEPRIDFNRKRIPLAGLPVPQLQPTIRYDSAAAFPLPPKLIQSNTYQSMRSASANLPIPQLPPYFSRSNQQDSNTTSITKQQELQQQSQLHPMWMTQTATQFMTGTMAPSQIAYWQNPSQEPKTVQYTHAQIQSSHSSLLPGGHFPKCVQMSSQQNHQILRISAPFPPIQVNSQHSPVPIWCDKSYANVLKREYSHVERRKRTWKVFLYFAVDLVFLNLPRGRVFALSSPWELASSICIESTSFVVDWLDLSGGGCDAVFFRADDWLEFSGSGCCAVFLSFEVEAEGGADTNLLGGFLVVGGVVAANRGSERQLSTQTQPTNQNQNIYLPSTDELSHMNFD
ncbi:hypothetical protein V2J09_023908 [Rumex salicifolius]